MFQYFRVPRKFGEERGGLSRFSVESFLSHSADKFRRAIFYGCIIFGYRESLDKRGGSIKIFRGKIFVSHCQKFP